VEFVRTEIEGAWVVDLTAFEDERGFFARAWCSREMAEHGVADRVVQSNLSYNRLAGTLRGMHYQVQPYAETKFVRCTRGSIYDVIIDLRPGSPTLHRWIGVTLSAENKRMLVVPEGFAHGFQTLEDESEVFYMVSEFYTPGAEAGIRWNDPRFGIKWPRPVTVISPKDAGWPDYQPETI
jgi:dTDP-4-dehydrorhamnose 3,5-epimerase